MRAWFPVVLAMAVAVVGCKKQAPMSDEEQVKTELEKSAFFQALGAIPGSDDGYTGRGGGLDGDTSLPVAAWRVVKNPVVNYQITVQRPYAEVAFQLQWPCTLFVVYTDLPDTSIRDTVIKPAPKINGAFEARFAFAGDSWHLDQLSPCKADFDSGLHQIEIESLVVRVRRGGQTIEYPTLVHANYRLPIEPYPYTFVAGDTVDLRLWEAHAESVDFAWTYLHGPPNHHYSPFQLDTLNGSWYGSWVINQQAEHKETRWVWFEVVDLNGAILQKHGPDRAVLWGMVYMIQ